MNFVDIPEDYICPITQDLMKDPVVAADGQSYEREAIMHWLQKGHMTSPLTGERLKHDVLIVNHRLKAIIEAFKQSLPEIQRERQMKVDMDVAIRLREEIIAQDAEKQKEEIIKYDEALKKKDQENNMLKENLLEMQRKLQEMQVNIQAPISENQKCVNNAPKTEISNLFRKLRMKKQQDDLMVSDVESKSQGTQAKSESSGRQIQADDTPDSKVDAAKENRSTQARSSLTQYGVCSICHLEIIENLVFTNEYCRHRYCLYCIEEAGKPGVSLCYLKACSARLDVPKLTKFYFSLQTERENNQVSKKNEEESKGVEIKVGENKIQNIKADQNKEVHFQEAKQKKFSLLQGLQSIFGLLDPKNNQHAIEA